MTTLESVRTGAARPRLAAGGPKDKLYGRPVGPYIPPSFPLP